MIAYESLYFSPFLPSWIQESYASLNTDLNEGLNTAA